MRLILAVGEGRSIAKPRSNIFWQAIWAAIDLPALSFDHRVGARPRDLQSIVTRASCGGSELRMILAATRAIRPSPGLRRCAENQRRSCTAGRARAGPARSPDSL